MLMASGNFVTLINNLVIAELSKMNEHRYPLLIKIFFLFRVIIICYYSAKVAPLQHNILYLFTMEHPPIATSAARLCVFARLDLTRLPPGTDGYTHIDENNTSKLHLHAYNYGDELVKSKDKLI